MVVAAVGGYFLLSRGQGVRDDRASIETEDDVAPGAVTAEPRKDQGLAPPVAEKRSRLPPP